jgi:hypothetical protein
MFGLTNFGFQAMTAHHWGVAAERTFFQWSALITAFIVVWNYRRVEG